MIKKLIVIVCFFVAMPTWAQDNTASPYSYYGLGEVKFNGTQDAKSMGGLSIVGDSIQLALMNPASFSKLKLTTFAVGGTNSSTNFKTQSEKEKAQRTSFDYLAVGLPFGKFGAAFGLKPYTAVGYKNESTFTDETGNKFQRSQGNGFINKVFLGGSYQITKKISLGAEIMYHFGDITNDYTETLLSPDPTQYISRKRDFSKVNGFASNFGMLYQTNINSKLTLHSSITYSPESRLSTNNSRNISTVAYAGNGAELIYDNEEIDVIDKDLIIPSKVSFGAGIGKNKSWLIGTEITLTENKKLVNRFEDQANVSYENSTRIALGGYYVPKYDSFSSYFERIIYRAGFKYENIGLVINNQSIKDYGINIGFGLPLGFSKVDLGFELGKRGTTSANLIEENYFNLSIGLNLGARWFEKRKID
ncbi:hypothetical protein NAT47_09670 [Flavobacterium sp. HXWNR69]|uniref:Long-chain fatty acid transport protein n=1 Tax=Flavobacterium fragile TaxID=2949085 RepID=A0ABT0TIN8_9FLAO|nr:hypothetical protein [Flavobacterium sp. HXWNR69]MCL9770687.1 hypothetical protein [Flavobacterium sp. HXWNR69]